jgi:hypothetical protein
MKRSAEKGHEAVLEASLPPIKGGQASEEGTPARRARIKHPEHIQSTLSAQ